MILHHKFYPSPYQQAGAQSLVILHGLYGQSGNWAAHARVFAAQYNVYALDARNHGQSAHSASMRIEEMADDVLETLQSLGLQQVHLLGHSMGGKIAMLLALRHPQVLASLVVVDIAPVAYASADHRVLNALLEVDLQSVSSRQDADRLLARHIEQEAIRNFLLTNLVRAPEGGFSWRINLPVIRDYFTEVTGWPEHDKSYAGPVLFIRGALSDYILPEHQQQTLTQFPQALMKTISGAGHWVHSEKPQAFQKLVLNFLAGITDTDTAG